MVALRVRDGIGVSFSPFVLRKKERARKVVLISFLKGGGSG